MQPIPSPAIVRRAPSLAVSKYWVWMERLGYPQLDVLAYPDGEWAIIEYLRTPIIPSMTPWRCILQGMKNIEITYSFLERYVQSLDPQKKAFWEREDKASRMAELRITEGDKHRAEMVHHASQAILRNPDLCERIARNGVGEMNLWNIRKNISGSREPWKERPWLT